MSAYTKSISVRVFVLLLGPVRDRCPNRNRKLERAAEAIEIYWPWNRGV